MDDIFNVTKKSKEEGNTEQDTEQGNQKESNPFGKEYTTKEGIKLTSKAEESWKDLVFSITKKEKL